jgi:hypothetical protein
VVRGSRAVPGERDTICANRPSPARTRFSATAAFKGHAFAAFIASRPELVHIRTRRKSPGQNRVRERVFGLLRYEHLYRMEIETLQDLAREVEADRQVFNYIRPHEARLPPAGRGPSRPLNPDQDRGLPTFSRRFLSQVLDAGRMMVCRSSGRPFSRGGSNGLSGARWVVR